MMIEVIHHLLKTYRADQDEILLLFKHISWNGVD